MNVNTELSNQTCVCVFIIIKQHMYLFWWRLENPLQELCHLEMQVLQFLLMSFPFVILDNQSWQKYTKSVELKSTNVFQ